MWVVKLSKFMCFLAGFSLVGLSAQATVVVRQLDVVPEGWSASLSASFEDSVAATQKRSHEVAFSVQHKTHKDEWRSFGSAAYGEVNDVENEAAQMLHLRHVRHAVYGAWRWESFAQTETDDFANLGHRNLLGTGPSRLFELSNGWRVLTLFSVMREAEDHSSDSTQNRRETRASLSLQGKYTSAYGWTLDAVGYWQPNLNGERKDRRVTTELALSFPVSQKLTFTTGYAYRFNGVPFEGVPRESRKLTSGFNYKF
jgi:hypothetical protein